MVLPRPDLLSGCYFRVPTEHRLFLQSQGFSCLGAFAALGLGGLFFSSVRWVKNAVLVTAMSSFSLSAILKMHLKFLIYKPVGK